MDDHRTVYEDAAHMLALKVIGFCHGMRPAKNNAAANKALDDLRDAAQDVLAKERQPGGDHAEGISSAGEGRQRDMLDAWSFVPVGAEVTVRLDNGEVRHTKTRSGPWMLGGHTAVILLEGISGGYSLERVQRVGEVVTPNSRGEEATHDAG